MKKDNSAIVIYRFLGIILIALVVWDFLFTNAHNFAERELVGIFAMTLFIEADLMENKK